MLPFSFAKAGETVTVRRVGGKPEVRQHLSDLGFVDGAEVEVVQAQEGNLIIKVKGSRLAITKEMAEKIMVQ